jgi:hypothetical protein
LIAAFPFAALACKRGNAALESDAGDSTADVDAGPSEVVASASSSPPPPRVVPLFDENNGLMKETPLAPRSWSGSYKCKARLTLTQGDNTVIGRMNVKPDDTSLVCTISGDTCTGTETESKHPKTGKAPPPHTRKLTLRRDTYGNIHYSVEGGASATCPKL